MTGARGQTAIQPHSFGRFNVRSDLGHGAMGKVYRVVDPESGEELALKSIAAEAADQIYFLKREFRTLAELEHPNLVQFHELFSSEDSTYFTMELIDGEHFGGRASKPGHPRPPIDYRAFREASAQLVEGVAYLHFRDKLHRDLKPSNVLVARDGRVVLLDFGLATSAVDWRDGDELVGTLAYMAPECFFRAAPAPAADWFSVGVMLYEALTGALPFPSSQAHILTKQHGRFTPLNVVAPETPEPLVTMVHSLLAATPSKRPGPDALRSQLREPAAPRRPSSSSQTSRVPFLGRAAELELLQNAFEASTRHGPALVMVEGKSGEGKTTLVERFAQRLHAEDGVAVFKGRCHPSEFLAFKAIDGVVDDLSQYLAALGDEAAACLGPQHMALCRVFPVMARIGAHSATLSTHQSPPDVDVRRAAFAALRDLLQQVSLRQPVLICIDDLQWGHEDSGRLLIELLRPAQHSRILFILAFRSDERQSSHCVRVLDGALSSAALEGVAVTEVGVQPFAEAESRELVKAVLSIHGEADPSVAATYAELVARNGQGNPFILTEFARYVATGLSEDGVSLDANLSDMLRRRFERLPLLAQRLASMTAIAARPLSREILLDAAQADVRGAAMLQMLVKTSLLRTVDVDTQSGYIVYHEQIRQALLGVLPTPEQVAMHAQLAETLLGSSLTPDPEHVLEHLLRAEQRQRAAPYAFEAAVQASRKLAFETAATLFELSLELGFSAEARWRIQVRHAEALANAGRGQRAAEVYLAAASAMPSGEQSSADLRRRAAEQFLHAGCLTQGQSVLAELLEGIGVSLPQSTMMATLRSVTGRLRVALRGRKYALRPSEEIDPTALARVDLLWAGTTGLSLINHTQSDAINVQLLDEALKLGERSRVARVLSFEAASEASIGGFLAPRSLRTLSEAQQVADGGSSDYDRAFVLQAASVVHWFQERWRDCVVDAERSIALYRSLDHGTRWEQSVVQSFRLSALAQLGQFPELATQVSDLLHDARMRGDTFAAAVLDGAPSFNVWLAKDNPERALELTRELIEPWPGTTFLSPHYRHLLSLTSALLYQGRPTQATEQLATLWPAARKARFLMLSFIGAELRFLRGRTVLAQLAVTSAEDERRQLLSTLELETKALARQRSLYARAGAHCLRAGLLEQLGSPVLARDAFLAAEGLYESLGMLALTASCRLLRAKLQKAPDLIDVAAAQLSELGVVRRERFARTVTVGDVSRAE